MGFDCSADIIGVIAGFLTPTTKYHQPLMLVCTTWYQGVVEQDGMRPNEDINWPMDAMKQRQPNKLKFISELDEIIKADLVVLAAVIPEVESLNLSDRHIETATLTSLQLFHNLRQLVVDNSHLNNAEVRCIATNATRLTHLDISWNAYVTDEGLKHIGDNLVDLEFFSCKHCSAVSDAGVRHIARLSNLSAVKLRSCDVTNAAIEALSGMHEGLTALNIAHCNKITDACAHHFLKMKRLQHLKCYDKVTDAGLEFIGQVSTLLELTNIRNITDIGLRHISQLANLTILDCHCSLVMEKSLRHISHCAGLADLTIAANACEPPTIDFQHLGSLKGVQYLTMIGFPITDAAMEFISTKTSLVGLTLCSAMETTKLDVLQRLGKTLTTLNLSDCLCLTDAHVQQLSNLRGLKTLELAGCTEITDAAMMDIARMKSLEALSLAWTEVSDAGLRCLSTAPRLTWLNVQHCDNVTNEGLLVISDCVEVLMS